MFSRKSFSYPKERLQNKHKRAKKFRIRRIRHQRAAEPKGRNLDLYSTLIEHKQRWTHLAPAHRRSAHIFGQAGGFVGECFLQLLAGEAAGVAQIRTMEIGAVQLGTLQMSAG